MKVAIIGGAGFVGSHLTKKFVEEDYQVDVVDAFHLYSYPIEHWFMENLEFRWQNLLSGASLLRCDILDVPRIYDLVGLGDYDYVVSLAALPIANQSNRNRGEALSILRGTMNLLEALKDSNVRRFTYISSSMVYGDYQTIPIPEYARTEPVNIYGASKLMSEILVRTYAKSFGIPTTIVRPSAIYGPTDCNMRVVQKFLHQAFKGKPVSIVVGNDMEMDFTHVSDAATGIFRATTMESGLGETFNITFGHARSLQELVEIIKLYFEDLEVVEVEDENIRPSRGTSDITKARLFLHFRPAYKLEDGIANYVKHMYDHNSSLL